MRLDVALPNISGGCGQGREDHSTTVIVVYRNDTTGESHREQAYVPAEQPSASESARFSDPYADPRGPGSAGEPSPQGSASNLGLICGMLPFKARLTDPRQFRVVTKRGRRAAARTVVVHVHCSGDRIGGRAGFIVSKRVGNSVVRHRVTRRLRELVRARLGGWPCGTDIVVRALPPAATASSGELGADLDASLGRARALGRARVRRLP